MQHFPLNKDYSLSIEPHGKEVRLIVFKDGIEYVCRKERIKKLDEFIQLNEPVIFKGRLQLQRQSNEVLIVVKSEIIGFIESDSLANCLLTLKHNSKILLAS